MLELCLQDMGQEANRRFGNNVHKGKGGAAKPKTGREGVIGGGGGVERPGSESMNK